MAEIYDGVIYGDYSKYTRLRINYTVSQNETTAVSTITMNLYAERTKGSEQYNNSGQAYWNLTGKGNTSMKFSWAASSLEMHLGSSSTTVQHNPDGTGSVTLSGYWYTGRTGSSYIPEAISISKNITLKTIPRASSVSGGSGNIGGTTTISVSRASTSFTHTLRYAFGSLSGTIATGVGTSYTWTIPTSFYAQIPSDKSGWGTIYCDTYNGTTLIGTKSTQFTATVTEASSRPTVSATLTDTNATTKALTGNASKMVKGKSTGQLVITSSVKNSAKIKSVTVNGTNVGTSSSITLNYSNVSTSSFTIVTTDSRGYTNTSYVLRPSYVNYVPLTVNTNFFRPQPTKGEVKLTYSGNYFNASFGSASNTLSISWKYKVQGASDWTTGGAITPTLSANTISSATISLGTSFDYQTAYDFQLVATDKLTTITVNKTVSVGMPVFYWGKDFFKTTVPINSNIIDSKTINANFKTEFRTQTKGGSSQGGYISSIRNNTSGVDGSPQHGSGIAWGRDDTHGYLYVGYGNTAGAYIGGGNADKLNWVRPILTPTTLYSNSSGTTGTITLSESVANFSYIEIYYGNNINFMSQKIFSPNGKRVVCPYHYFVNNVVHVQHLTLSFSTTTVSRGTSYYLNYESQGVANDIAVFKIIGYR